MLVTGLGGYTAWTISSPSLAPSQSNHAANSTVDQHAASYDYSSHNLVKIIPASDLPELIEFHDGGEQETAGLALTANTQGAPALAPTPNSRPAAQSSIAQAILPIPETRPSAAIPAKLNLPATAPQSPQVSPQADFTLASTAQPNSLGANRQIYTPSEALSARLGSDRRSLRIYGVNVGERLSLNYFQKGRYDRGALAELDHLFRDRHTGKVAQINPGVYDQLFAIANIFQNREINMISGYRAPETNEAMRRRTTGIAKFSYHVRAQAADFYVSGVSISEVHIASLKLSVGGVGYYPSSNFVHVDVGPLRNWPGRYADLGRRYRQA